MQIAGKGEQMEKKITGCAGGRAGGKIGRRSATAEAAREEWRTAAEFEAEMWRKAEVLKVPVRYWKALQTLDHEEAGELFDALLLTAAGEKPAQLQSAAARVAFEFLRPEIEADAARQRGIREKRRKAVNSRWTPDGGRDETPKEYFGGPDKW